MIHRHLGAPPESGSPPAVLKKGSWSVEEDRILIEYVRRHGEGNWNVIQRNTALQRCGKSCRLRWTNHLRPNLKKGAFSSQEERLILDLHSKLGNKWARISAQLPGRTDNEVKNYWNTRVRKRLRQGLPLYPYSPPQQPPVFLTHLKTPLMDLPFPPPFFSFTNTPGLLPHVDLQPPIPPDLDFDYKLELPSNPNVIHTRNYNSGLLDALLQEAHTRGATATATHNLNKEDCLDGDKRDSVYANSSTENDGGKMEEQDDDDMYYRNEDLSSIFNLIPSLVKQPKENNGNHHQESSNGHSSNVSEDNTKPEFPSNTEWLSTSTSYTSWDNLPSIW